MIGCAGSATTLFYRVAVAAVRRFGLDGALVAKPFGLVGEPLPDETVRRGCNRLPWRARESYQRRCLQYSHPASHPARALRRCERPIITIEGLWFVKRAVGGLGLDAGYRHLAE